MRSSELANRPRGPRPGGFFAGRGRRLVSTCGAAIELHAPEPLPGVRYVAWDATA